MQQKVNWHGYEFTVCDPKGNWNDVPGIYIFVSLINNGQTWHALYVGMTENFKTRMGSHERWDEAVRKGACAIHGMIVSDAAKRETIEEYLIRTMQPEMNVHFTEALSMSALLKALGSPAPTSPFGLK